MIVRPYTSSNQGRTRQCVTAHGEHKRGYLSRAAAKRAVRSVTLRGGIGVNEYVCADCGRWHIGKREQAAA